MKTGLVLEGGGMRGMYTAGVIDTMIDKDFCPDIICGTSAGVTFGINLPSHQRGRVIRYNTRFAHDKRYISIQSWLTTGNMINVPFAYDLLPRELDPFDEASYEACPTEFYATVTNVQTGLAEYIRIEDCFRQMDYIRASASLPIVSRKVRIGDTEYLDGGLVDNIPLDKCLELGCDRIIVVLTRPKGYVRNDHITTLCRMWYPHDHALIEAISHRNERYMQRLKQIETLEQEGRIFVIRPSEHIEVSRLEHNTLRLNKLYQLGLSDSLHAWSKIETYIQ